jgi:hypothetical protein
MIFIASIALGGTSLFLALGGLLGHSGNSAFMLIVVSLLWFGHPIMIEEDLRRRGLYDAGCLYILMGFVIPPLGAGAYLVATYRDKAAVLIPMYVGLVSSSLGLGWGLGHLAGKG